MLIPIGTDNPLRRRPLMNYLLIAANVMIFLLTYHPQTSRHGEIVSILAQWAQTYKLFPADPALYQFITYAFLHASWGHIIGNMLFLYIFGANVNDKLGNLGYLLLYLGGAVFSGLGHTFTSSAPVLGASGAVATVTGAYMVLFPKTYIHVLYVIFFIGSTEIPAIYFILLKLIVWDNILGPNLGASGNIAYTAHLAGYAFGIAIPLALLALKMLPHSHFDLWALLKRSHRRQQFRSSVNAGYEPFGPAAKLRKKVDATVTDDPPDEQSRNIAALRTEIAEAIYATDLDTAAGKYLTLIELDHQQVLPQQQQLDIANKLMQTNRHAQAAAAYEVFINRYQRYPFLAQSQLMLGLIYSRYLNQKDLARKHLTDALEKLSDPGQKQMCQDELAQL